MSNNFYVNSANDKSFKYKQSKESRNHSREYNKIKRSMYKNTAIILILMFCLITSIVIASGLYVKNNLLVNEISQQSEVYLKAVEHYENLNEYTADNAVNDFMIELTSDILDVDLNSLTKTKLKTFIAETELYIFNFSSIGLQETHPEIYEQMMEKYNNALYALENETYLYPYSDKDYVLMCNLVMREQGADVSSDEAQCLVAWVALNRKNNGELYAKDAKDPSNPTLLEVITQKGQYGPNYSYNMNLNGITDKVKENVRKVFEHEFEAPENVLFQTGIYYPPEKKTMYKKIWNPEPYNSYTYFYYGKTVN